MKWYRALYFVFIIFAGIAYFLPWCILDGKSYTGWENTIPFGFFYLVGVILGIIAVTANYKPIGFAVIGGILMLIGVFGVGSLVSLGSSFGAGMEIGNGLALALLMVFANLFVNPLLARKFKRVDQVQESV
jgi:membrane-bound ClpP family serine protease